MWFTFAIITTLLWGVADLFYKKGANEADKYSHLKTSAMVGFVMGIHAIIMLIFFVPDYNFMNIIYYLPVSAMYILSMSIGYFGLRYLELSIISPIQNSSGAFAAILCFLFLGQTVKGLQLAAIILISLAIFGLGVLERRAQKADVEHKKYKIGFVAFLMPILYCIIDAIGTFLDGFYLDDVSTTFLKGVTEDNIENVANISYELTFLIVGIIIFCYIVFVKREKFNPFTERDKGAAAIFETAGQFTYVFAMSSSAIIAAPMIASYSIISVILSRIFLKEKLSFGHYVLIALVMVGIAILGLFE